jgi:endonuclease YncB( thermonuclease family)
VPIDRPRRIFRSGLPKPQGKTLIVVLVVGLTVAAGVSLAMLPHRDAPSAPAATAEELNAQPAQVAVVDGGTLRLRDRVVRLLGVDPPARGTPCGGSGQDCGAAATNALAAMVREVPVACRVTGLDGLGRPYAICRASGTELNSAVIAAGWARANASQPDLKRAEETARAERRGVWAAERSASW